MTKRQLKTLILTDTATKARALRRLLGRTFTVESTDGFLRNLPKTQAGIDPENDFALKMITVRGKAELLKQLRRDTFDALRIYIATEPVAEGEALAAQYCELFGINPASKCRVELRSLTKNDLRQSIENARAINPRSVEKYWTRRLSRRLITFGINPYLWCAVYRGLSINPLQLLLLRLIDRFEPTAPPTPLEPAPVTLKTLQMWAARDLHYAAGRVVLLAQQLYEGMTFDKNFSGLIKYFRSKPLEPTTELPPDDVRKSLTAPQLKVYEAIWNGQIPWLDAAQSTDRPTDFSLMLELERLKINWSNEYSPSINVLVKGNYLERSPQGYALTELGREVLTALDKYFGDFLSAQSFVEIGNRIKEVSLGQTTRVEVLRSLQEPLSAAVSKAMASLGDDPKPKDPPVIESDQVCDKCGRRMVVKRGRYGKFLACPGYPECQNTKPYVEKLAAHCPKCGGRLTARTLNRRRTFYGCERYPTCDFWTWDVPQERACSNCGSTMLLHPFKDRPSMLYCSNEQCPSRENHPINKIIDKVRRQYEERRQKESARNDRSEQS